MPQGLVLVTGATGMVGYAAARRLVDAGYAVRAMVRDPSRPGPLRELSIELVAGDLAAPETLPATVRGVQYVVHAAAHVGDWGPAELYRAINVIALEHFVTAAAREPGFQRWIQISSLGVYPGRDHHGTDETAEIDVGGLDGYTRTKAEAEIVLRTHMDRGFPAVILRPGFIYGPGDRHVLPRIVEKLRAGKMKLIGDGRKLLNNTYVGNLVDAVLLALESDGPASGEPASGGRQPPDEFPRETALPRNQGAHAPRSPGMSGVVGETFNIRDARLVDRVEFVGTIADYLGSPRPKHVPLGVARAATAIVEMLAKATRRKTAPLLTQGRLKFLTLNLDYSIEKARRVLGYQGAVDFQQGMKEALDQAVRGAEATTG